MDRNLVLLTLDWEPCQLVPMWLITLASDHCHTGQVFVVIKLKKRLAKPLPNDSRSGTVSVGSNMVNYSPFGALSHWWHVHGNDLKKRLTKPYPKTLDREPC